MEIVNEGGLPQIIIKSGRMRAMANRHPWIFSGAVKRLPKMEDGDIAEIISEKGERIGYGFYAPGNQIVCRVFEYTREEVAVNTEAYWHDKLKAAYELRKEWVLNDTTNAYRLIHAEGDFLPGLVADVYADTVVMQFLIKGTERIKDWLVSGVEALGYSFIYNKTKEVSKRIEGVEVSENKWLSAKQGKEEVDMLENGVKFRVNVATGQKTGFFLDQRDARNLLGTYSKGKKVLNTFSYSGGFSMYALQEGASLVHSVDSSDLAVQLCDENVKLNGFDEEKHKGFTENVFEFLKEMPEAYDIIILDPPAFAKTAKAVKNASRGYKQLNLQAFRHIKPGGLVFTFSCSQKIDRDLFRKIVFGAAADAGRNVRILHQTTQPADHPVNIFHPENEYLKGLVLQVE